MEKQEKTWMYLLNIVACFAVIILHCCTPAFFSYKEGISTLSLGVYLIHQPILNMAISIFKLDIYSKVLYFIVPVLLYIFCALITKIIKKIPYIRVIMP